MPPNTVYIGRPTKWGNPFPSHEEKDRELVVTLYAIWLGEQLRKDPHFLDPLKGKNLACWCRLDRPCHADIILKILKEEVES